MYHWQMLRGHYVEPVSELHAEKLGLLPPVNRNVNYTGKQETSRRAAARVLPRTGTNRQRVYDLIRDMKGLTCDQVCESLDMLVQTATPTIHSLVKDGHLRDSGLRRETRSGHLAIVWCLP